MHTTDPSPSLRSGLRLTALRMTTPRCHPERSEGSLADLWATTSYYSLSKTIRAPFTLFYHTQTGLQTPDRTAGVKMDGMIGRQSNKRERVVKAERIARRGRFTVPIADFSAPNHIDAVKNRC